MKDEIKEKIICIWHGFTYEECLEDYTNGYEILDKKCIQEQLDKIKKDNVLKIFRVDRLIYVEQGYDLTT